MGLDMNIYKTKQKTEKEVDFFDDIDQTDEESVIELFYWRKHPNIHGMMEKIYNRKGGEKEFNCVPVKLNEEDLSEIEFAIKNKSLPTTGGFFFGESVDSDEEMENDLDFIEKAKEALEEGYTVFYTSWW